MPITDLASFFFHQIRTEQEEAGRMYDPVIGIVTDNKDPDKLARVKVKIPTLSADDTTWWCPVIAMGAGKNRGWFFIPEVDDEVLVMFEHGDMQRPIVVGALWNGKDKPPEKNPGGNPKRVFKSRAGDLIEFDDDGGKVTISDGGGKGVVILDQTNKITIKAKDGDVCLQSPTGELTIVAKEADFQASQALEILTPQGALKIGAGGKALIGGKMLQVAAQPCNLGASAADFAEPSASPAEVADPYGG
jgi:uncharacterized protein involved in type VI secretion and phage assembly